MFLNFKNNKISYETDDDKIKLFSELRLIDELSKKFKVKKIISKYCNNILEIKDEVINNERLRKLLPIKINNNEEKKENNENIKMFEENKEDTVMDLIRKQLKI